MSGEALTLRYKYITGDIPIVRLYPEIPIPMAVGKAGVLPFVYSGGAREYLLMRPKAEIPALGMPEYQIGKGTRRVRQHGKWRDVTEREIATLDEARAEDLLATALREGEEELGLKIHNIATVYLGKSFVFRSATTGAEKTMFVAAAEMKNKEDFAEPSASEGSTESCRWMTLEECRHTVRADHLMIVEDIDKALTNHKKL